ncbi:MAG: hypothetical protein ACE3JK_12495 [Sporolactobacillus sp.]
MNNDYEKHYVMDWDIESDFLLPRECFKNVMKFHQSTVLTNSKNNMIGNISQPLYDWCITHQKKAPIPQSYLKKIQLEDELEFKGISSERNYDKNYIFPLHDLSVLLHSSFGAEKDGDLHRKYPSAGALYPVYPIVYVFNKKYMEGSFEEGVYYYDGFSNQLLQVKKWTEVEMQKAIDSIKPDGLLFSHYAIGYVADFRKAIIKYRSLGYKHVMLEAGMMVQQFRDNLVILNKSYGDLSYSGFNDNALTKLSGFDVSNSPVILVQWFGRRRGET